MAKSLPASSNSATIEADLRRLEVALRQLKVQYDMFFAGALKLQPLELRAQVDRIIKRYANTPMQKYAQQFHLNTLLARYNSLSELWGKTIRAREEGVRRGAAAMPEIKKKKARKLVARGRFGHIQGDDPRLRELYDRFVEARSTYEEKAAIPYEKFVRGISAQTRALQKSSGCGEIELRVVVSDRKVELKARAGD